MHRKYLGDQLVDVIRTFKYDGVLHAEVKNFGLAGGSYIIEVSKLTDCPVEEAKTTSESPSDTQVNNEISPNNIKQIVAKKVSGEENDSHTFDYPSDGYARFIKEHALDQEAIDKCLNGSQKTHKGWKFS